MERPDTLRKLAYNLERDIGSDVMYATIRLPFERELLLNIHIAFSDLFDGIQRRSD
jgi:hypothetical protein